MNKKGAVEISITTIIVIIIGVILFSLGIIFVRSTLNPSDEKYCEKNPNDCEAIAIKDFNYWRDSYKIGDIVDRNDAEYLERMYKEVWYTSNNNFKWVKKNPCQLKLEKEGILGEECLCEEEKTEIKQKSFCTTLYVNMTGKIVPTNNCTYEENYCIKAKIRTIDNMSCQELEELYPQCNPLSGKDCSKEDINHQMILKKC